MGLGGAGSIGHAGYGMRTAVSGFGQLVRLNVRVAALALRGHWMQSRHVASGYDRAAPTYDEAWQKHLRPVTDDLLDRLPGALTGTLVDLGCGTGYTTRALARDNPAARIVGVDVSSGMLWRARHAAPAFVHFECADMLAFMRSTVSNSCRMIVSTWSLGYSRPPELFKECARALSPGGTFAFIVNYFDTLAPVFRAYQQCMLQFPERVRLAAWPHFPKNWPAMHGQLTDAGLTVQWHVDGRQVVASATRPVLAWLRQTGILAGFDSMLDLSGEAETFFEEQVLSGGKEMVHHYAAVICTKP